MGSLTRNTITSTKCMIERPPLTTGTIQANGGMDAWCLQKFMSHANMANTNKYVGMSPKPLKDAWWG
jgi:hypothetical protein